MNGNQTLATQVSFALDELDGHIEAFKEALEQLKYKVQCAIEPAASLRDAIRQDQGEDKKAIELLQVLAVRLSDLSSSMIYHDYAIQHTGAAFAAAQEAATRASRHIGGRVYVDTCSTN